MTQKKRFGDRSPAEKGVIGMVFLASLAIVGFAERDLHLRPPDQVRGSKLLWRLVSLNAVGALAYLGLGRR
ncbi:MAG: hypothetical protein JST08_09245 [Actinobacteria bacterium]|nr:hypothetical protein [Actinomycetota bacterium]